MKSNHQHSRKPFYSAEKYSFYLQTWSGRILIINTLLFLWMAIEAGSLGMPSEEVLVRFGAKDPVKLAEGEWWRFLTPIFIHIGIIHFLFNSYALKYIGPQIESVIGAKWFIFLYILSGVFGNALSSVTNVGIGAGASGSIFGLIGIGLVIENIMKRYHSAGLRKERGTSGFTGLAIINLILGFLIPGIDNAAHIGGLLAGSGGLLALLYSKPNRLLKYSRKRSFGLLTAGGIIGLALMSFGSSPGFILGRLEQKADNAMFEINIEQPKDSLDFARQSYFWYTRALKLDPNFRRLYTKRGIMLLLAGDRQSGFDDLALGLEFGSDKFTRCFQEVANTLEANDRPKEADAVRQLMTSSSAQPPVSTGFQ